MATLPSPTGEDDYFYEDLNADFSQSLGDFKTENPTGDRFQRQFVHVSSEKSRFKKTTELVLCVHGWDDESAEAPTPMTLVVLGVSLSCHGHDFRYQSVTIRLKFDEDDKGDLTTGKASPRVEAYAPFVRQQIWNESEANVTDNVERGGSIGAEYIATASVDVKNGTSRSFTRRHFDKGTASPLVDERTGRIEGVEWYCQQNKLQDYGVEPYFQVAALVRRANRKDGTPINFRATYDMEIDSGFRYNFEMGLRKTFRLRRPEDAPIYFDPSRKDPLVNGSLGEGKRILERVKKSNLGDLAEGDRLRNILDPIGGSMDSLAPLEPL